MFLVVLSNCLLQLVWNNFMSTNNCNIIKIGKHVVYNRLYKINSVFSGNFSSKRCSREKTAKNEVPYFFIFASLMPRLEAIVNDIHDTIGWSNLDLENFQYFKNPPSQRGRLKTNIFLEHFQRKKAILDYFENLFFGNLPFTRESEISFDPQFGQAWRSHYARKFGWKGERLIEALGKGYSIKHLKQFGAIPRDYGAIYPS